MQHAEVSVFPAGSRATYELIDKVFPSRFASWQNGVLDLNEEGTHFGYVRSGMATVTCESGKFTLRGGMYFSTVGATKLRGESDGFVATRLGWQGFFCIGGPAEEKGRLTYIDGCSDSLLICPVIQGDPCLNLLYLPPGTTQTEHTHPSCRVGMIASGRGTCITPTQEIDLHPGLVFNIAPGAAHSFHTTDQALRVIAWHPDSDFGPVNHDHPMINRTIIDGVSASQCNVANKLLRK